MDIPAPIPIQAVERELRGSRQSLATVLSRRSESPQRAQHAFYRYGINFRIKKGPYSSILRKILSQK
uniref:Uncharacterized protein n=1 Tax=Meloidogyne incognita TaxID=6306 RepID=A0A914LT57_MELIC